MDKVDRNINNESANNNVSVFESPKGDVSSVRNEQRSKTQSEDGPLIEGKRLESEEFENISMSAIENIRSFSTASNNIIEESTENNKHAGDVQDNPGKGSLKLSSPSVKRSGSSFDKFEPAHDAIEEEDLYTSIQEDSTDTSLQSCSESLPTEKVLVKVSDVNKEPAESGTEDNDGMIDIERDVKGIDDQKDREEIISGRPISLREHYNHIMEMRRRSDSALSPPGDKPSDNYSSSFTQFELSSQQQLSSAVWSP